MFGPKGPNHNRHTSVVPDYDGGDDNNNDNDDDALQVHISFD